jgi:hypothetical protein
MRTSSPPDKGRRRSPPRNRRRPARRHSPARRLLPDPAALPRPLVQDSLQAADERLERDVGARTLDHRTKAATHLRWHSRRQPSSRPGAPSARRSPSSVLCVGRLQGIWAEDRSGRPRRRRARRSRVDETISGQNLIAQDQVPGFAPRRFARHARGRSRPQRLRAADSLRPARPQCATEPGALHTSCPARRFHQGYVLGTSICPCGKRATECSSWAREGVLCPHL